MARGLLSCPQAPPYRLGTRTPPTSLLRGVRPRGPARPAARSRANTMTGIQEVQVPRPADRMRSVTSAHYSAPHAPGGRFCAGGCARCQRRRRSDSGDSPTGQSPSARNDHVLAVWAGPSRQALTSRPPRLVPCQRVRRPVTRPAVPRSCGGAQLVSSPAARRPEFRSRRAHNGAPAPQAVAGQTRPGASKVSW